MEAEIRNALILLAVAIIGAIGSYLTARVTALNAVAKQQALNQVERDKIKTDTDELFNAERKSRLETETYIRGLLDRQLAAGLKLESENERLRTSVEDTKAALNKAQDTIDTLTAENNQCQIQVKRFEANLAQVTTNAEAREKELYSLTERYIRLNAEIEVVRKHIALVEQERDKLVETVTRKNGELKARDETIADLRRQIEDMEKRIGTLEERLKGYEATNTPPPTVDPPVTNTDVTL